jgi:hypothetical protein
MRTTLDIPAPLIEEAMQALKLKTKTSVIIRALEELIRKKKIEKLKNFKGKINLDIDLSVLRDR